MDLYFSFILRVKNKQLLDRGNERKKNVWFKIQKIVTVNNKLFWDVTSCVLVEVFLLLGCNVHPNRSLHYSGMWRRVFW